MRFLTTPWRMKYVIAAAHYKGCIFCDMLAQGTPDEQNFILHRAPAAFLVLNIYPYTPGHLLAIPYRHVACLSELTAVEMNELLDLCRIGEGTLRRAYGCRSIHIGANLGRAAGAGVPGHLHFHIVSWPARGLWERWSDAEEPPETLADTFQRLRAALTDLGTPDQST